MWNFFDLKVEKKRKKVFLQESTAPLPQLHPSTPSPPSPEDPQRRTRHHKALLQVAQHVVEHPDVRGVSLLGVIGRPHGLRLEEGRVVPQQGGRGEQR